ncbi:LLM class F420-dependent oxidoreductase [Amycolatopsis taiwanensis]|uniref:LLM class F420-dependent oxidoreductase n=1 Tax=Amycolatopsis taiwanensis TaxID=342230 RepID=A0A9W6QXE3_9PSEU|nr:LLM class F420-dependent oxidoreductase [Amycolatopsis taiwanensis]GLY65801.1 LLM class F420-dependent oxidoreductase [Amycolatopsis taiwanensis]
MDFGVAVFNGSATNAADVGHAVEQRGFESLFYPEHTHIPLASRRSDGRPVEGYGDTYDPFVALAAAAATTSTIRLGTAVCLVPQRDPFTVAKAVASVDRISGGRFEFGVGSGWNQAEMANHGVNPRTRTARMIDHVRAMRTIWADDEAEYHGEYVDFAPLWSWPKPVQRPGPPVLVGGNGPGTEDRVLEFGDGWLPQAGPLASVAELRTRVSALRQRAAEAGRARIPVTLFGTPYDRELVAQLADAGVDRCLFPVRDDTTDNLMRTLDELATLIDGLA